MEAIEFKAKIKNGVIHVPEKFRQLTNENVKVIILTEPTKNDKDIIDKLLASPIQSKDFTPLSREACYER